MFLVYNFLPKISIELVVHLLNIMLGNIKVACLHILFSQLNPLVYNWSMFGLGSGWVGCLTPNGRWSSGCLHQLCCVSQVWRLVNVSTTVVKDVEADDQILRSASCRLQEKELIQIILKNEYVMLALFTKFVYWYGWVYVFENMLVSGNCVTWWHLIMITLMIVLLKNLFTVHILI